MTNTEDPSPRFHASRRAFATRAAVAASAAALLAGIAVPANALPLAQQDPAVRTPIEGDVVTCLVDGESLTLTGVSGAMVRRETTRIDGKGRAHVLFTIRAANAVLTDSTGASYQMTGRGHDRVLYPTTRVTGDSLRESIRYRFDIVGAAGRIGVVRFALNSVAGKPPTIVDRSTCEIPQE
jgi:anaerobic selenocysteine-containing dehydrogenase